MDTSDPRIDFDAFGVCNHCRSYDYELARLGNTAAREETLRRTVEKIKWEGRNREYDSILGLSGGVDSSYAALIAKELGLRPLAVPFHSGSESEIAVSKNE